LDDCGFVCRRLNRANQEQTGLQHSSGKENKIVNRINNFLLGALLGGLVGAAAGILLAPSSGAQLRSDISSRVGQIRQEVTQAAADRRAELEHQLAELRAPRKPEPM
jgi:hypothetical protein